MPWLSQRSAFASFDTGNSALPNSIAFTYFCVCASCIANFINLLVTQFRMTVLFAKGMPHFIAGIMVIIGVSSRLKVIWIHAGRIIARMQQYFTFRYFTLNQLIANAMRTRSASAFMSANANRSIASCIRISQPKPAGGGFIDLRPKSFFKSMKNLLFWLCHPPLLVMRSTKRTAYCWLFTFGTNFSHGLLCHEVVG